MNGKTCAALAAMMVSAAATAGDLACRWVYVQDTLVEPDCVERISNIVWTAKAGGMNGVMLTCGLDFCRFWPRERHERFARIKRVCDDAEMEIIPSIWTLGYGGLSNYGLTFAEGFPVEDVPLVAKGTNAVLDVSRAWSTNLSATVGFQRDGGYRRLIKKVKVKPHHHYRYSFEFRTKDLVGDKPFKVIEVDATLKTFFEREFIKVDYRPTQDWTPCSLTFSSGESDALYLYIGFMSGWKAGDFEVRNVTLAEIAPRQILRRPGTPRVLRNAATGATYEEGRDYTLPKLYYRLSRQDMPDCALALPPGSRIKAGDRLVFSCYAPAVVNGEQVSTCLSEPALYEAMADSAARIEEKLHPAKWMLSMDEFRNGGTCAACRARGKPVGEMYAAAVTRAFNTIRKVHPGADVHIWSDMLDPNHNSVKEYYNCIGSFEDTWKGVPKEIIPCCWYNKKSHLSMPFFSQHGFRTMAAAYYDEKPPFEWSRKWCDVVRETDGARGIMYTTWRKAYVYLPAFCEMIKEKEGK